jgi:hypothetical protein
MEVYYPVQMFKAPLCEVENQIINKNKSNMDKKNRRKFEGRFNEEITNNICEKSFYIYGFTTHVFFTGHYYIRISFA